MMINNILPWVIKLRIFFYNVGYSERLCMSATDDVNSYEWDYCSSAQLISPWSNMSLRKKTFFLTEAEGGFSSVLSKHKTQ